MADVLDNLDFDAIDALCSQALDAPKDAKVKKFTRTTFTMQSAETSVTTLLSKTENTEIMDTNEDSETLDTETATNTSNSRSSSITTTGDIGDNQDTVPLSPKTTRTSVKDSPRKRKLEEAVSKVTDIETPEVRKIVSKTGPSNENISSTLPQKKKLKMKQDTPAKTEKNPKPVKTEDQERKSTKTTKVGEQKEKEQEKTDAKKSQEQAKVVKKTKCLKCKKLGEANILVPTATGKKPTLLCTDCLKSVKYCSTCKGVSERAEKAELDRCKACGWVNCDVECTGACGKCGNGTLRGVKWKQCSQGSCGQRWAESNKWCASCGKCSLKSCAGKLFVCKIEGCRVGLPRQSCSKTLPKDDKPTRRITAAHFHCEKCMQEFKDATKCGYCNLACKCDKCSTCSAGDCCNFQSAQLCRFEGCEAQVCRRCEKRTSATGKASGMCREHHGKIRTPGVQRSGSNERSADEVIAQLAETSDVTPAATIGDTATAFGKGNENKKAGKNKKRRCTGCGGTERQVPFKAVGENLYCKACIPAE
eukprot:m.97111 g.97111  ORF g.97111 m.97111 type:complete len:533 (+) comp13581_c0_seq1:213-1811(+)